MKNCGTYSDSLVLWNYRIGITNVTDSLLLWHFGLPISVELIIVTPYSSEKLPGQKFQPSEELALYVKIPPSFA